MPPLRKNDEGNGLLENSPPEQDNQRRIPIIEIQLCFRIPPMRGLIFCCSFGNVRLNQPKNPALSQFVPLCGMRLQQRRRRVPGLNDIARNTENNIDDTE